MNEFIAALSAAVAVLGWGCFAACAWRYSVVWGIDTRRSVLLAAITTIALGLAVQQTLAVWAWETGLWNTGGTSQFWAITYRVLWAAGLLGAAGAASYPACGHKAWLALAGAGVMASLVSLAV